MKTKHTKGPWIRYESIDKDKILIRGEADNIGYLVATLSRTKTRIDESEANAYLIAAAPTLLEVAKRALDEMIKDGTYSRSRVSYDLEDAIDKAEGEEK